jgi:FKBP-type peptidyl-prolyl cis-trans isomerase
MIRLRLLALALLTVGFTACLDTTAPDWATVENTTYDPSLGVNLANSTATDVGVYYRDITVGTGPVLTAGQEAYYYYRGNLPSGAVFDSLQPPKPPNAFTPGNGEIMPALEIGMQGMRVGGRRQVLVPPNLAYGMSDLRDQNGNVLIPGNTVIVFDVQLVDAAGSTGSTP